MERVKRLASNEIELDMEIPMIESQASNIPTNKGNYVCCHECNKAIKIASKSVRSFSVKGN